MSRPIPEGGNPHCEWETNVGLSEVCGKEAVITIHGKDLCAIHADHLNGIFSNAGPSNDGANLPVGAVLLGKGRRFRIPYGPFLAQEMFTGWMLVGNIWGWGSFDGRDPERLYAAPADSEIARLNRDPLMDAVTGDNNCKDALIRELVGALQAMTERCNEKAYNEGFRKFDFGVFPDCKLIEKSKSTLALARTTCPEAFDGCSETSTP